MRDGLDPQGFIAALDAARRLRATRPDVYARLPEILRTQADMLRFTNQRLGPLGPNATPDDLARRTRHIQRILSQKTEWKDAALAMAGAAFGGRGGGRRPGGGRRSAPRPSRARSASSTSPTTKRPVVVGKNNKGQPVTIGNQPTGQVVGQRVDIRKRTGEFEELRDRNGNFVRVPVYEWRTPKGTWEKVIQFRQFDHVERLPGGRFRYWKNGEAVVYDRKSD